MDRFDFFAGDMLGMWVPLFLILLGAGLVWIKRFSRRSTKKMVVPSAPIPPQASDEPAVRRKVIFPFAHHKVEGIVVSRRGRRIRILVASASGRFHTVIRKEHQVRAV